MAKLSKEKLKPYMRCPRCNSNDLVCTDRTRLKNHIMEEYHCYGCTFEWSEKYRLTLEEIAEHGTEQERRKES